MVWTMPTETPKLFQISGSGWPMIPACSSQVLSTPSRRSSATQAKARASTETQSGSSTQAVMSRCRPGRAETRA